MADNLLVLRRSKLRNSDGRSNLLFGLLALVAFCLLAPYFGLGAFMRGSDPADDAQLETQTHTDQSAVRSRDEEAPADPDPLADAQVVRKPKTAHDNSLSEIEDLLGDKKGASNPQHSK